jgi:subtilase family serine protease
MRQEAANIIVVDSPTVEDTDAPGLPIEAVLAIVAVAAIAVVVAVLFFMRKKKK